MKKRIFITIIGAALIAASNAQSLGGYFYGNDEKPSGWEWQSPDSLGYNKLQPHAYFFNFSDRETAQRVLPENSAYVKSLTDKRWRFHWVKQPSERPQDFFRTDFDDSSWDEEWVPMCWNTAGRKSDGTWKYGRPIYSNQRVIFQHKVAVDDWRGGVMRPAPKDWLVSEFPNEVGSYRRTFTVPKEWEGREVYINFDGVDSFFYLWVNGRYVGFAKNSRNLAEFDITAYLNKNGDNIVAVEVYRNSDGSFLESQDMFRLPGIIRSVYLTAKPKVHVSDLVAIPTYEDRNYTEAVLNISATVQNLTNKAASVKMRYSLYEVTLYGDHTKLLESITAEVPLTLAAAGETVTLNARLRAGKAVRPWTAEEPQRYVLVGEMLDKKGNVLETISTYTGFRQAEIRQVSAAEDEFGKDGRYYLLNGKPIKMKGVNRHETSRSKGHAIDRYQMEREVLLMKRGNINHVRNSHYPDDPYWYYLCDKYGIMLEDEANIESHEYYYWDESLSHVKKFRNMHVARNMEMVRAHVNHPSILIWSLGNEAGPGENFRYAYDAIKAFDTSRPVQYERDEESKIVDFFSNQYPAVDWVRQACQGNVKIKYPMHISEYAHSMGNALGNLVDYWEAIESSNYCMGGAIWDWVDQAILAYDPATKKSYNGYGGDFRDKPNDGMFCMNGIMRPDHSAKPQYYEVKKVYQNVGVTMADAATATIEIFNKNYFTDLSAYDIYWNLWKNGEVVKGGRACFNLEESLGSYTHGKFYRPMLGVSSGGRMMLMQELLRVEGAEKVGPRERRKFRLDIDPASLDPTAEYFVEVQFCLKNPTAWAPEGYVQMEEQLLLQTPKAAAAPAKAEEKGELAKLSTADGQLIFTGKDYEVAFDRQTGELVNIQRGDKFFVADEGGLHLDAFRAPTDNDNWACNAWVQNGLDRLQHRVTDYESTSLSDGRTFVRFTVESQAAHPARLVYSNRDRNPEDVYTVIEDKSLTCDFKFTSHLVYTIYPDGAVELQSAITSNNPSLDLPRIGYSMKMPKEYNHYVYYGRGPENNYNDRRTGQFVETHYRRITQDIPLPHPQAMGNREEVRWCQLTDMRGDGLLFMPTVNSSSDAYGVTVMSSSALPYTQQELMGAAHPYQLPASSGTVLHLDAKVTGLGGNSCGQGGPFQKDRVKADGYLLGFLMTPVKGAATERNYECAVTSEGGHSLAPSHQGAAHPILATQDRIGNVTLTTAAKGKVMYSINDGTPQAYTAPIPFRQGGTLKTWIQSAKDEYPAADQLFEFTYEFEKILKTVPLDVIYTSSFEPGEGEGKNFVDGNPRTIWHTQYGVTLAKYPHWVDFDAAQQQQIKGFIYTPRTDGSNGYVKDYEIYVSQDNKEWSKIHNGTFQYDGRPQRVLFSKPVRARYIRFYALNEQSGAAYASGAEFGLIVE